MNKQLLSLISVIVPIYNSEKYLSRCIKSICDQTYNNIEIILVNDGSKDTSLSICKEYKANNDRIKVIDIPNGGVSNARNTGLAVAKGEYIQFIDSDDYVAANYIERLLSVLEKQNAQLAVCSIESFDSNGNMFDKWSVDHKEFDIENPNRDLFLELIQKFLLFGPVNKLYFRNIIEEHDIKFDTSLSYGEDLLFNFEYLKHVKKLALTNEVSYHYIHENTESLSKKNYENKTELAKRIHYVLLDFFTYLGFTDEISLKVLYSRLFDYYYNMLFAICNNIKLEFSEKKSKIRSLLNDKELKKSFLYFDKQKYAGWIIFCMKYKLITPFILINGMTKSSK
ncbi:glycosyltransferase family 2 protein [Aquimarina algicola]|uniref:Glycosyltransferase family 2 protein n=1 Tax=Aquimarina algicola TaxID=2589995 RepID=A0A504JEN8_9FLAO|nr:glycosyltransferase family 2 protein [Aquimarina algicola]TPN89144.1 glycosyltransferase family 2 protein [Aquimarina algicola]